MRDRSCAAGPGAADAYFTIGVEQRISGWRGRARGAGVEHGVPVPVNQTPSHTGPNCYGNTLAERPLAEPPATAECARAGVAAFVASVGGIAAFVVAAFAASCPCLAADPSPRRSADPLEQRPSAGGRCDGRRCRTASAPRVRPRRPPLATLHGRRRRRDALQRCRLPPRRGAACLGSADAPAPPRRSARDPVQRRRIEPLAERPAGGARCCRRPASRRRPSRAGAATASSDSRRRRPSPAATRQVGCWSSDGRRLDRSAARCLGPGGVCTVTAGVLTLSLSAARVPGGRNVNAPPSARRLQAAR